MPAQHAERRAARGVPSAHGTVPRAREQTLGVGRKSAGDDVAFVPFEGPHVAGARAFPQPRRAIPGSAGERAPVGAHGEPVQIVCRRIEIRHAIRAGKRELPDGLVARAAHHRGTVSAHYQCVRVGRTRLQAQRFAGLVEHPHLHQVVLARAHHNLAAQPEGQRGNAGRVRLQHALGGRVGAHQLERGGHGDTGAEQRAAAEACVPRQGGDRDDLGRRTRSVLENLFQLIVQVAHARTDLRIGRCG